MTTLFFTLDKTPLEHEVRDSPGGRSPKLPSSEARLPLFFTSAFILHTIIGRHLHSAALVIVDFVSHVE